MHFPSGARLYLSLADKISIHSREQWHFRAGRWSLFNLGSQWFETFANKTKTWLISRNMCPTVWLLRRYPAPAPDPWAFASAPLREAKSDIQICCYKELGIEKCTKVNIHLECKSYYLSPGVSVEVFAGVATLVGPVAKVEALLAPHTFRRRRAVKYVKRVEILNCNLHLPPTWLTSELWFVVKRYSRFFNDEDKLR